MPTPHSASLGRLSFVDLFRGIFALLMLEGHITRALLNSTIKAGAIYHVHELAHSLTGAGFLFASGAAFGLATVPRWDSYRRWSKNLAGRLGRLFALLAIGCLFHLTYFSFRQTIFHHTSEQLSSLLSMDILQCIAVSGLLLQLVIVLLPTTRWFLPLTIAGCAVMGLVTPLVWTASARFPWWLGGSFNERSGSLFPLFPFLGFYLAGSAWGYVFVQAKQEASESRFLRSTRRCCAWLILGGLAACSPPLTRIYGQYWNAGPAFFFPRLGIIGLLMVLCHFAESRLLPALKAVVVMGRESLVAYIAHLVVLYGSVLNPNRNLSKWLGSERTLVEVALILLLLAGAMIGLCWIWNRFKRNHQWKARGLQWSLAGYLIYCFVVA